MGIFVDSLFADPLFFIGAFLAGMAAIGFVLLLAGMGGLMHALKENGHAHHVSHQRVQAAWGFYLMVAAYVIWKILEWLGGAL